MSVFEQIKAAEAKLKHIRTVEAAEVDALWEQARIASKEHSKKYNAAEYELIQLKKEWLRVNNTKRCG